MEFHEECELAARKEEQTARWAGEPHEEDRAVDINSPEFLGSCLAKRTEATWPTMEQIEAAIPRGDGGDADEEEDDPCSHE
jgi:hypothetical protein